MGFSEFYETAGIFQGGRRIVNAAGANDDEKARIDAMENCPDSFACFEDSLGSFRGTGKLPHQMRRRRELMDSGYAEVVGLVLFQEIHGVIQKKDRRFLSAVFVIAMRVTLGRRGRKKVEAIPVGRGHRFKECIRKL